MDYAPFLVCVVPLSKNIDPNTSVTLLSQCDEEAVVNGIPRFKQRYSFIALNTDSDFTVLDTLKVSDTVLFLISAATGIEDSEQLIDEWGNRILMSSMAQGLPTPIVAVTDLESIGPKKRNEFKQHIQKLVQKWLPEEKLMVLDKNVDGLNILRRIGNQKRKSVLYRDRRPHLLGENVEYLPDAQGTLGTLKITGYLRGTELSVDQLVHIPGLGDFQMLQIDALADPNRIDKNKNSSAMDSDQQSTSTVRVIARCDPAKQESLDSENVPDPMDAEQTKKVKRVPKGWSDYQAAWIPDDDAEFQLDESSSDEEGSENEYMDAMSEEKI
ncbi:hypothetical protein NQ318_016490 [Aromia moschata]|uniref:Bms1-type G domain-containing protein n=1 Tax=Aromia moschata TaxID=1265417 RepID=A0AAV8X5N3_9CUCU|nr:hypothetical protein NQ318_016490 [Aromia moschata]